MRHRLLLATGAGLLAAALVLAGVAAATGRLAGPAAGRPGGMMAGLVGAAPSWGGGTAISIDQAQRAAQATLDRLGDPNLVIDEMMEFQDNFYVAVREKDSGTGAFELLVSRNGGAVSPEPGPNMMWNTSYGTMAGQAGGMMGGVMGLRGSGGPMTVSAGRARQVAQQWLDRYQGGSTAETPDAFHGYYTVDVRKNGTVTGMLSVNGHTGQVWYHTWHGAFIQQRELDG